MDLSLVLAQIINIVVGALLTAMCTIIAVRLPALISAAVRFSRNQAELVRARFTTEQLALFDNLVLTVIRDIEQRTLIDDVIKAGWEKRQEALQSLQDECERLGIPFDAIYAGKAIEAAIKLGLENSSKVEVAVVPDRMANKESPLT